jgi:hypothetical protein
MQTTGDADATIALPSFGVDHRDLCIKGLIGEFSVARSTVTPLQEATARNAQYLA